MNNTSISFLLGVRHIVDETLAAAEKTVITYLVENRNSLQKLTVAQIIKFFNSEDYKWKEEFTLFLISKLHSKKRVVCTHHLKELDIIQLSEIKNPQKQKTTFVELSYAYERRQFHLHGLLLEKQYKKVFDKIEGFMK